MDIDSIPSEPVVTDIPLVVEDLLCQAEDLLSGGSDLAVVDDLLVQVAELQSR